ncbi:bifunctional adenosylcobinamide kinase/adenosylcobinamide-phosphate guanylyltransferase [Lichenibacterium dinghuense]|uniref:bifunctional adenosylcobinamide kinase/adenosylcobinamide-phosphate guanylyltransferase n=1 Tax=Lichenibacterium dinghuense TaxID=2895977 RepID=UPI001F021DE0|nr:bifunctional adenosylcobinamide kinase/adenosylcobinamide-phosphate guanylyltransferase [Lichenibacterium sp. 6Y81]
MAPRVSPPHTLVIGGARSGKSRHAEALALGTGLERVYLATATAWDDEMRERIALHREARAADGWRTVEEPLGLAEALSREAAPGRVVLVDCLTLWLTNVMLGAPPEAARAAVEAACAGLAAELPRLAGPAVFVSNEVGWGIVPDNRLARDFRDAQGRLNQRMAEACGRVVLVAAGLPLVLKGGVTPP